VSEVSEYPEHDKLARIRDKSQTIGEFLDMGPWTLCKFDGNAWYPYPFMKALAEWFEIDEQVLENEKRTMLAKQRELNDG